MSARGVDCLGATMGEDGVPIFLFMCDCGSEAAIRVEDLADLPVLEFAFTCHGCESSHWLTVGRMEST